MHRGLQREKTAYAVWYPWVHHRGPYRILYYFFKSEKQFRTNLLLFGPISVWGHKSWSVADVPRIDFPGRPSWNHRLAAHFSPRVTSQEPCHGQ